MSSINPSGKLPQGAIMETTEQQSQPLELGQQNCLVCILLIVNKILLILAMYGTRLIPHNIIIVTGQTSHFLN